MVRSLVTAAILCAVVLGIGAERAFAQSDEEKLGISVRTPVVAGQAEPALVIEPTVALKTLDVTIERKADGKQFLFNFSGLARGTEKVLAFAQPEGKAAYEAFFAATYEKGGKASFGITFEAESLPALRIDVSSGDVDLDGRTLRFTCSRAAAKAEVTVYGEGGAVVGRGAQEYTVAPAKAKHELAWTQEAATVRKLDVKVTDTEGFWSSLEVRAFFVEPWEDRIYFATGSDAIEASEVSKLEATLTRIREAIRMAEQEYGAALELRLYIAGYTDTVGSTSSNQDLSNRRARSIGRYFGSKGLTLPMYYQGFGESVLAVQTPDETNEERNRRTLYVLSSQTPVSQAFPRSQWKRLD